MDALIRNSANQVAKYVVMRAPVVEQMMIDTNNLHVVIDDNDVVSYYGEDSKAYFQARDHYRLWRHFFNRYCGAANVSLDVRNLRLRFHKAALEIYYEVGGLEAVIKHCEDVFSQWDEDNAAIFPSCVNALNEGVPLEDIIAGWR